MSVYTVDEMVIGQDVHQRTAELGPDEKGLNCDSAHAHVSDQESNSGDCSGFFDVSGITGPRRARAARP